MAKCDGCNKKKKMKKLNFYEGFFESIFLCAKCFMQACKDCEIYYPSFDLVLSEDDE